MKPNYKKPSPPATVIVRRRAGNPSSAPAHTKAACGHPLETGRNPAKRCRACCKASVDAEREQGRKNRALKAQKGRLPNGSRFELIWNVKDDGRWHGLLEADVAGTPRTFTADAANVFTLLQRLDFLYRKALPENTTLVVSNQPAAMLGAAP